MSETKQLLEIDTAPAQSRPAMENVQKTLGFIPNLYRVLAEAPAAINAYSQLGDVFGNSSLSAVEQQVVLLTVSRFHKCRYCMAAHSTVAQMVNMDAGILSALRNGEDLPDPKLNALSKYTYRVIVNRGWPDSHTVRAFEEAGYGRQQALEVLVGISMKTLSNYVNHISSTPVDEAFQANAWSE